jgi:SAM-dependent methyltransferase
VRQQGDAKPVTNPTPGSEVEWGSFRRLKPFSQVWAIDRGLPIDRYYVERFVETHAAAIGGDVLEIQDARYTTRFGTHVRSITVCDVAEDNREATLIADLSRPKALPAARYDCIVATQTLEYIFELEQAVRNLHRGLAPAGVVLATVPCVTRIDPRSGVDGDFWRFTTASVRTLFEPSFGAANVEVQAYGNLLVCTAFLQGLAAGELTTAELEDYDPFFPLLITVRAVRSNTAGAPKRRALRGRVGSLTAALQGRRSSARRVEGNLDEVTCGSIWGWAWNRAAPEQRLRLEIWDGNELIGSVWSDQFRADLARAGKGDGRVAFQFSPEKRLHRHPGSEIRVIAAGGGEPLDGSPRRIECRCPEQASARQPAIAGSAIDLPREGAVSRFPWLELVGWVVGRSAPVHSVELLNNGTVLRRVTVNLPRGDVAEAFPKHPWAHRAGFATKLSLVGVEDGVTVEVLAVLEEGAREVIGQVDAPAAEASRVPVVAVLAASDHRLDQASAVFNQTVGLRQVLVSGGTELRGHPGVTAVDDWRAALADLVLDERPETLLWLCDGREGVTSEFLAQAAASLDDHPEASFAVAVERPIGLASHELATVLSGAALGTTILCRASAVREVGGVDLAAPTAVGAQWDLAVRLAQARHEWVEIRAMSPNTEALSHRAGEDSVRWLYHKHASLYERHLGEVLLSRDAVAGELLRVRDVQESQREADHVLLRSRRRERNRLSRKLRSMPRAGRHRATNNSAFWGDLRRLEPFSDRELLDRGVPVDLYYLERFLQRHTGDIRGTVLEWEEDKYARRYGGSRVSRCDVIDLGSANTGATLVSELRDVAALHADRYDCAILTNVLNLTEDPEAVLAGCRRILKPGGVLLASVPSVARISRSGGAADHWRFSLRGFERLLQTAFAPSEVEVEAWGNTSATVALLAGLSVAELGTSLLDETDPAAAALITGRAVRPATETPRE